jgi:carboxyl-terminal processing protease
MINSRSASASEIVSGALSDHGRAKVVGERSFGKGSVQELRPLEGGNGLLKMTTKYYFLPNGRHLQKAKYASKEPWGVDPSEGCIVPESNEENSERIRARLPFVDIGGEYEQLPEIVDDTWVVDNLKDNALGEAIDLLRKRNELDTWPELPEDDDPMFDSMAVGLDTLMKRRDLYEKALAEVQDEINQFEGMALESKLGLDLPEETVLEEPVIAIYDSEGNLIGKWQVDKNDDLGLMLSTTKLVRIEDDSDDMQDE